MRVLVTGGAGFIGANLVRDLLALDHDVVVLDDFSAGEHPYLDGLDLRLVRGAVQDPGSVRRAVRGCEAVVHLAAVSGVARSVEHPERDFRANVEGTFNVLDAARRAGVHRVVFASSGAVLAGARPPLSESQLPSPLAPYGASKLYGEAALQAFQSAYEVSGVALRLSNVYGPFCSHKTSVVAAFARNAVRGRPLVVYGSGRQTRDFLHVADVTRAIGSALRSGATGVLQLGTGVETSINRLAALVSETAGRRLSIEHRPSRGPEAGRNVTDITRARRVLRFNPRIELREGLASTLAWIAKHESKPRSPRSAPRSSA
jgi:UDP-glucose 4-epimerase